jgi:hypothetical protein
MPRLLLILDDDRERLRAFDAVMPRLGKDWMIRAWCDASTMAAEVEPLLSDARLISLDHDLYRNLPSDPDPGSGRVIADLLSKRDPVCPVIVHSTNTDAAWGMFNELTSARWNVELVHHLNQLSWIEDLWLPVAMKLARL